MDFNSLLGGSPNAGISGKTHQTSTSTKPPNFSFFPTTNHHALLHNKQHELINAENGGLSNHVRTILLEESPARCVPYEPEKVIIRDAWKTTSRDIKTTKIEKEQRRQIVSRTGFASGPKELYRPLGDPITNTQELIFATLGIETHAFDEVDIEEEAELEEPVNEMMATQLLTQSKVSGRLQSDTEILKGEIEKNRKRLHAVKYCGAPLATVVKSQDDRDRMLMRQKDESKPTGLTNDGKIDWRHWKVDHDKQLHYKFLYESALREQEDGTGDGHQLLNRHRPTLKHGNGKYQPTQQKDNSQQQSTSGSSTKIDRSDVVSVVSGTSTVTSKNSTKKKNLRMMEEALGINKTVKPIQSMEKFFTARNQLVEDRVRLSSAFQEDLRRIENLRPKTTERKYNSLKLKKTCLYHDDLEDMRVETELLRKREVQIRVIGHPWFKEMCHKLIELTGRERYMSKYERLFVDRVRCYVEDQTPFDKYTLSSLFRLFPTKEIMKEDIQKYVRYIKSSENISEKEYLMALEMAGHVQN